MADSAQRHIIIALVACCFIDIAIEQELSYRQQIARQLRT